MFLQVIIHIAAMKIQRQKEIRQKVLRRERRECRQEEKDKTDKKRKTEDKRNVGFNERKKRE